MMRELVTIKLDAKNLNKEMTVRILLPEAYHNPNKFFPVLYMHDGQNLFEDDKGYLWIQLAN